MYLDKNTIIRWLRTDDPTRLQQLWAEADKIRQTMVGPTVYLRGLVEFSNCCVRHCAYCGLRAERRNLSRYRMTKDEIVNTAFQAEELGYGTVVLQSGQDTSVEEDRWLEQVIRRIKEKTSLAVTLSVGEREPAILEDWREAGADRYLLRFETSDERLYRRIHPPGNEMKYSRLELLQHLRALGYEVGSGSMIGIPGQNYASLADDILLFRELDLDMIGVGPFIAHPETPLAAASSADAGAAQDQVPASELMCYKTIALSRLVCPEANIPSTTALATINRDEGREYGLERGANVVMPNVTPPRYRLHYEIYPNKACLTEDPAACNQCIRHRIHQIGRVVGTDKGFSPRYRKRQRQPVGR